MSINDKCPTDKEIEDNDRLYNILNAIAKERVRQEELRKSGKFLWTCADSTQSNPRKLAVLAEEFGEVAREVTEELILRDKVRKDPCDCEHIFAKHRARLRAELIQVAAVCVAWCEALDEEEQKIRDSFSRTIDDDYDDDCTHHTMPRDLMK